MSAGFTRVEFFDGQVLGADAFRTQQRYLEALGETRNAALHSPGIVDGLTLTAATAGQKTTIEVRDGMALDNLGRPILLHKTTSIDLPARKDAGFYVVIEADEQPMDLSTESGAIGYKRVGLDPRVTLLRREEAPKASQIVLGEVIVDDQGNVTIDRRVCVYSGTHVGEAVFLFGAHDVARRPYLRADAAALDIVADSTGFSGHLKIAGTLTIVSDPASRKGGGAQLDVSTDSTDPGSLLCVRSSANDLTSVPPVPAVLTFSNDGMLGVNVDNPTARLTVQGDIQLDADCRLSFDRRGTIECRPGATATSAITLDGPSSTLTIWHEKNIALAAGGRPGMTLREDGKATICGDQPDAGIDAMLYVEGWVCSLSGGIRL